MSRFAVPLLALALVLGNTGGAVAADPVSVSINPQAHLEDIGVRIVFDVTCVPGAATATVTATQPNNGLGGATGTRIQPFTASGQRQTIATEVVGNFNVGDA